MKKKNTKAEKGKKTRISLGFLGGILLVFVFFLSFLALYLVNFFSGKEIAPPVYEETYVSHPAFKRSVKKVDHAVYDLLYRNHKKTWDVVFKGVKTRQEKGRTWDFVEMVVRCPNRTSAMRFKRFIYRLNSPAECVRVKSSRKSIDSIEILIYVKGCKTHRILLNIKRKYKQPRGRGKPRIAIVIDDLGYDMDIGLLFARLPVPITLSFFPCAPYSHELSSIAYRHGHEVMLHLPMEPKGYPRVNPGPGALFVGMSDGEIKKVLIKDLNSIPNLAGVNNHMGSAFTENSHKMLVVLQAIKKRHLFFIDSRTTPNTVAYSLARRLSVPSAERNVFLDNEVDTKSIGIQMERLLSMAEHKGKAIGIGHPYPATLKTIHTYIPLLKKRYELVPVSSLLN